MNIFHGRGGVIWSRDGVVIVAAGVPTILKHQLLSLIDESFLENCFLRILAPVPKTIASINNRDKKDIMSALNSSGITIARESIRQEQSRSSKWFTASWAQKVLDSVSGVFGFGGAAAPAVSTDSALGGRKEETTSTATPSICNMDPGLISALLELWSLTLVHTASSQLGSLPWKSISYLVYVTNAIEKLMDTALYFNVESFSSPFDTNQISCNILACLSALLRIRFIALDDSELYENGKPVSLEQLVLLVRCLKSVLFCTIQENPDALKEPKVSTSSDPIDSNDLALRLSKYAGLRTIVQVLGNVYARWARRPFSSATLW